MDAAESVELEHVQHLLQVGGLRVKEAGRRTVALSLAEAETIRRILHQGTTSSTTDC
jgi:hypothetical protein